MTVRLIIAADARNLPYLLGKDKHSFEFIHFSEIKLWKQMASQVYLILFSSICVWNTSFGSGGLFAFYIKQCNICSLFVCLNKTFWKSGKK